jgi:hypothetical protein
MTLTKFTLGVDSEMMIGPLNGLVLGSHLQMFKNCESNSLELFFTLSGYQFRNIDSSNADVTTNYQFPYSDPSLYSWIITPGVYCV